MDIRIQQIKIINIILILSIGIIGGYWSTILFTSSNLGANDKDIISIIIAIVIALATLAILTLFIYSTVSLIRGVYKESIQKLATILVVTFVVISDLFVFRFFSEFSISSKIAFILINFITVFLIIIVRKSSQR